MHIGIKFSISIIHSMIELSFLFESESKG
jgi:hypothetical protein